MKKNMIFSLLFITIFITGCSFNQPSISSSNNDIKKLKKNNEYAAIVSRNNELTIVDTKTDSIYKTCKLKGQYGSGAMVISPDGDKAYILQNKFQSIYGYDLNSCENTFKADLSHGNIRSVSIYSIAVSSDGKQVYTVSNPTEMLNDRYKVLEPVFSSFNVEDGLDAKATVSFNVPRQISVLSVDNKGNIYASGADVYKIDPVKKEYSVYIKHRNWERKNYSQPDVLAAWPVGKVSNELLLMYTAAKFPNEKMDMNEAEFVWGATRIDLTTGEYTQQDFAPLESIMFMGMTHPKDTNILYGISTDLRVHDVKKQKLIKKVDLDHTYYCINFIEDGSKLYISGAGNDLVVYDPKNLTKLAKIQLPGDTEQGTLQVFKVK